MTTAYSRMNFINLRDRRSQMQTDADHTGVTETLQQEQIRQPEPQPTKLTLLEASYQPTNPFTNSRTAMRMLKGKVERGASIEKQKNISNLEDTKNGFFNAVAGQSQMGHTFKPRAEQKKNETMSWNNAPSKSDAPQELKMPAKPLVSMAGLKLVLPDEHVTQPQEKKVNSNTQLNASKEGFAKRILIEQPKEVKVQQVVQHIPIQHLAQIENKPVGPMTQTRINDNSKKQPKRQPEEFQNENELVECPEGCGRKFNPKALDSHAKACKVVFMSKRKEFNSQAKRLTNKQQANLIKQAKLKEKKQLTTKLQKTGEAWKTQSEGFRAVVKALKQQQITSVEDAKVVTCEFCEKKFNELLYNKHLVICDVKKEKEKQQKKGAKKSSKLQ